ncbi:hypothetical protein PybrP1_005247 [[Pythium] brassicae (nom. inval.)]|nr:hypothetical protein PybrP1_005247 [[Pythium] brassicae (nom. inval.)]
MAASAPENSLKSALDFFGKEDPDGVAKFKTVAFRALHEQRLDEELRSAKAESERLQSENAVLASELRALQASFDVSVGDRERVLAFKSKRIEELNRKLRESEAITSSLLQALSGGGDSADSTDARAAMAALLSSGKPLFHALAACREQEFRRLLDEKRAQCEQLAQQLRGDEALAREMRAFRAEKMQLAAELEQLRAQLAATAAQKDDAVHFLERKLVFEHDRLRRAKDADVAACRDAMEQRMRTQLDATTQRTVAENARVQLELRFQSAQLEQLVQQADRLAAEKQRALQEKRVFEDMSASLSKRLRFYEQLFAKMQERDQRRGEPASPPSRGRGPPPPSEPEPALRSPGDWREDEGKSESESEGEGKGKRSRTLRDGGEQLNAAADALEAHLQRREFARKQVDAALRYHVGRHERQQAQLLQPPRAKGVVMGQAPLVRKKIVLSKATYAPSSYQRGRRLADVP